MGRRKKKLLNKIFQAVFIVLLFAAFYYASSMGYIDFDIPALTEPDNLPAPSSGSIKAVYFCPEDACEEHFVAELDSARTSLDCALYDIDLESVKQAFLAAQERGVEVKIISDDKQAQREVSVVPALQAAGLAVLDEKEGDYMHDKFCVIDGQRVWVGSMNATENGVEKNNNNAVVIESGSLAANFSREVDEMWNGSFGSKSPAQTIQDTANFELYFCPEDGCAAAINAHIDSSTSSIDCMFFSLTLDEVGDKFIEAAGKGVAERFIFEKSQASQYSEHQKFLDAGIPSILDQNPRNMHNKLCIFDRRIVLTGSMNPSNHSENANDEVILFIDNPEIAQAYAQYFEKYWQDWS